jgi:bifunctional UDP-N-acetylglucosamine pyrophosphorylase/glucosamine-1-phosphate N-acetyltransferase
VLHRIGGKPMLGHVIELSQQLNPQNIITVIGHQAERVQQELSNFPVQWALQAEQLGTGHALMQAIDQVVGEYVLVLYGDVPLTRAETLQNFLEKCTSTKLGIITVNLQNPKGYGRIVRNAKGEVERIVEEKDANEEIRAIIEGNSGILCGRTEDLKRWLAGLKNHNQQGEYYLTDCIAACVAENHKVESLCVMDENEVAGVNNKLQLQQLERVYQQRLADDLLTQGVTLADRTRIDIRGSLKCGQDVFIDVGCVFKGDVVLGDNVSIGPYSVITNSNIGNETEVQAHSVIEDSNIANRCQIGPFARLRPGAQLDTQAKVGNFVEIKKAHIKAGAKVNHLSYVGDAEVGEKANIGAGTITCNYDGANKHKTIIGKNAFIGSNTALVAPVTVHDGATIGAGSTITKDAPADELTLERSKQITVKGWQRPKKEKH